MDVVPTEYIIPSVDTKNVVTAVKQDTILYQVELRKVRRALLRPDVENTRPVVAGDDLAILGEPAMVNPVIARVPADRRAGPLRSCPHLIEIAVRDDVVVRPVGQIHKPVTIVEVDALDCYIRLAGQGDGRRSIPNRYNIRPIGPEGYPARSRPRVDRSDIIRVIAGLDIDSIASDQRLVGFADRFPGKSLRARIRISGAGVVCVDAVAVGLGSDVDRLARTVGARRVSDH